jgi:hypothetical protein
MEECRGTTRIYLTGNCLERFSLDVSEICDVEFDPDPKRVFFTRNRNSTTSEMCHASLHPKSCHQILYRRSPA